jgi:hypothetical protein
VTFVDAPSFDRRAHSPGQRAIAARTWRGLLAQETASRELTARLVGDLRRLGAPSDILDAARRVAGEEARHVEICAHVIRALGFEPEMPTVRLPQLPEGDEAFEQTMVELLVAGFAVAETMSVGGFVAAREVAREPLVRWAFTSILRDEVGHGAFGEEAGAWAMRGFDGDRRRSSLAGVRRVHGVFRAPDGRSRGGAADPEGERIARGARRRPRPSDGYGDPARCAEVGAPRLSRLGVLPEARGV